MTPEYIKKLVELADQLQVEARKVLIPDDDEEDVDTERMKLLSDIGYLVGYIQAIEPIEKDDQDSGGGHA